MGTHSDPPETSNTGIEQGILERLEELGLIEEPAMACEMLDVFLDSCHDLHSKLDDSIQQADTPVCRTLAHTLKGSSRSVGAMRLGDLWFDLQKAADAGDLTDAVSMNTAAQTEFERVEKFLLELKNDLAS